MDDVDDKDLNNILEDFEDGRVGDVFPPDSVENTGDEELSPPDLSEEDFCLDCVHRPCLCTLLRLEMKIKVLREEKNEVKEDREAERRCW